MFEDACQISILLAYVFIIIGYVQLNTQKFNSIWFYDLLHLFTFLFHHIYSKSLEKMEYNKKTYHSDSVWNCIPISILFVTFRIQYFIITKLLIRKERKKKVFYNSYYIFFVLISLNPLYQVFYYVISSTGFCILYFFYFGFVH